MDFKSILFDHSSNLPMLLSEFESESLGWKPNMLDLTTLQELYECPDLNWNKLVGSQSCCHYITLVLRQMLDSNQRVITTRLSKSLYYLSINLTTPLPRFERRCHYSTGFKPVERPLPNSGIIVHIDEQVHQQRPMRELNSRLLHDREVFCH